jgi:hypothetical protein
MFSFNLSESLKYIARSDTPYAWITWKSKIQLISLTPACVIVVTELPNHLSYQLRRTCSFYSDPFIVVEKAFKHKFELFQLLEILANGKVGQNVQLHAEAEAESANVFARRKKLSVCQY